VLLLHHAATHGLKPLAMAEFCGESSVNQDKIQENLWSLCGALSAIDGVSALGIVSDASTEIGSTKQYNCATLTQTLPILYEDKWLIAVNKPTGLLSVPGRYSDRQDSVLSRLRHLLPDGMVLASVHRLDQETSGILLLARDRQTHRQLSRQFQQRQVHKVYEAVLSGFVITDQGTIELPLWADPQDRPYQKVDWQRGKLSLTRFRVIARDVTGLV